MTDISEEKFNYIPISKNFLCDIYLLSTGLDPSLFPPNLLEFISVLALFYICTYIYIFFMKQTVKNEMKSKAEE